MTNTTTHTSPIARWFLPTSLILLVWNLLGVMAFIQQYSMTAEQISQLPSAEQALYLNFPLWVSIAFACAVFAGTFGCMALALKKTYAVPLLWISLTGVIVQLYHSFFIANAIEVYGPSGVIMPVMVLAIAIYLVGLCRLASQRHWLS
ncbi:hypothetical protein [Paraglaciecola sp. 25GB23A]|uniref:hypothetical protein n=1 Tax=Paraglaciecola sp. 25GB23A TaxID=3156068 RepID=UPI0032AEA441